MRHVILDLYGCDPTLLADETHLRGFLSDLPARIGMQQVSPAFLEHIAQVSDPRDAGYSGFVIIAQSHVSLHAWPPYGMLNLDVFSCNEFDAAVVVAFACARFGTTDHEMHLVRRATRSPRQSDPAGRQPEELRPLDQCLYPGCTNRTGKINIAYCEEHRALHPLSQVGMRHPAP